MKNIILSIAFATAVAFAQTGTPSTDASARDAHRAKIEQAIAARDYNAWKAEHDAWNKDDARLNGKVTAQNFDKFAQMVEARKSGDYAKAQQLRSELGISAKGQGMGKGQGKGKGMGGGMGKGNGNGQGKRDGSCK